MEQSLLSKKELCDRWGISISTLDRRVREGVIKPVKGMTAIRFNMSDILKAEGHDKMSPFERRRLERDKEELKERIAELEEECEQIKKQLTNVVAEIMPILQR